MSDDRRAAKGSGADLVFVIGRQRSGTTVFRQLLVTSGAMDCDEIMHGNLDRPHRFYAFVRDRVRDEPELVHPQHHNRLFEEFVRRLRREARGRRLAIDLKYFALNLIPLREDVEGKQPFILRYIDRVGAHVLHIVRRNKLRIHVSEEMARATGKWSAGSARQLVAEKPKLTLDPVAALRIVGKLIQQDAKVARLLQPIEGSATLVYEEMFDPDGRFAAGAAAAAARAMGLAEVDRTPANVRMNPEPLADLVANHDEIAAAFRDTEHAWMLAGD